MKNHWCLVVIAMFLNINLWGQSYSLFSPTKNIHLEINQNEKRVNATLYKEGVALVQNIRTGLTINEKVFDSFQVVESKKNSFHEIWSPVWGKQQKINNAYNELILSLEETGGEKRKMDIIFRAYSDGIALRYQIPEQKNLNDFIINQDLTSFEVKGNSVFWAPNGEHPNIGPVKVSELDKDTNRYRSFETPLVLDRGNKNFLAIHEAAVFNFSYSLLKPKGKNKFSFQMGPSKLKAPTKTPWRVFMTGNNPGDLLESNLLYNLNPPCAIDDPSWKRTGIFSSF